MKLRFLLLFAGLILFLIAASVTTYLSFKPEDPEIITDEIVSNIREELELIDEEIDNILILLDNPTLSTEDIKKRNYPFYIYNKDSLIYWSSNDYVPQPIEVMDDFDIKLIKTGSETFLAKKIIVDRSRYIVSLIPLRSDYLISNDYLEPEWNGRILPSGNILIHENSSLVGLSVCLENNCLFKITFLPGEIPYQRNLKILSTVLIFCAFLLVVVLVYLGLDGIRKTGYPELGVFYLYACFFALRTIMTRTDFPGVFVRLELFDPQLFRASSLNASLGDLFLNTLALFAICYYVFRNFYRFRLVEFETTKLGRWFINVFCGLFILFAGLFPFVVIQTLYNNSSLVLDISQSLQFDFPRIIAILTVLLSGVCAFLFSHAFIRIFSGDQNRLRVFISFLIAISIFVLINEASGQLYLSSLFLTIAYFLAIYFYRLYAALKRLSYSTFLYLFIAIFCLAINGALAIQYFSDHEKMEKQFRFANNFLIDRDHFAEYLLHEASVKIAKDAFIHARIASPFLGKDAIGQKIRQIFLPTYFNKYDVVITVFNPKGDSWDNNQTVALTEIISRYNQDAFRTAYEGIYFVNNPASDITQKYLILVPIQRSSAISGYVVVELSLKKIIPENVYPELLVDYRFQQYYRTQDLSYALFSGEDISFSSGEFNYDKQFDRSWIKDEKLYTEGISVDGYDHIAQEDQNGRRAVVSSFATPFAYRVANFSFLFGLGLFIILLMIFVQGVYNYFQGGRLFFSARIQLYLNLAFFIPLMIVSISILGLTNRASQEQLDTEYLRKSRVFGQQITPSLTDYYKDVTDAGAFNDRMSDLATLSNLDANMYFPSGTLLSTSQPLIFESHLISPFINPYAYDKIRNGDISFVESEQVGKLQYFIAYTAIKSPQTAELIGILGIPFFQSAYLTEKAQIVILANILNIFAFIFIVLLLLSYFVSEWLTFPLRFITQSLKRTSLTKINHPLTWHSNDEIGLMVKEYNSMLYKLSESKNQLEHTQREKAWREIAQQVAHEIKNPLTPMKLTLQRLDRLLQEGNGSPQRIQQAIEVLLSQVDTLNDIASSFSGFAKMPELVIKEVELVSAVQRAVNLHSSSGDVSLRSAVKEVFVFGDEQMLNRTFSNLIINGLQSADLGKAVRIVVTITVINDSVRIAFQDNGKGIESSIEDLVFLPHFSTKKSGSGIGLAISKQAIEQMKGKIWFETIPGKGTIFFIELPVIA